MTSKNMNTLLSEYHQAGLELHWLAPREKRPVGRQWQSHPPRSVSDLQSEFRNGYNLGVRTGSWSTPDPNDQLLIVDVDIKSPDPAHQAAAYTALEGILGSDLSIYPTVQSGRGGGSAHFYTSAPTELALSRARTVLVKSPNTVQVVRNGERKDVQAWVIEVLGQGAQAVLPPSIHPETGNRYSWLVPLSVGIPRMPNTGLESLFAREQLTASQATPAQPLEDLHTVRHILTHIDPDEDYGTWITVGMGLHSTGDEQAFELWDEWSRRGAKYNPDELEPKWWSFSDTTSGVTLRSIYKLGLDHGWDGRRDRRDIISDFESGISTSADLPMDEAQVEAMRQGDIDLISARDLSKQPLLPREWVIDQWIPHRQTTSLYGDGSAGKTLLAIDAAIAIATGTDWFGHKVRQGPVIFLACEDEAGEMHRRIDACLASRFISPLDTGDLHIYSGVGKDNLLMTFGNGYGSGRLTPLWHQVRDAAARIKPSLIVFDTLADVFGGNEIDRGHVRQFVGRALTGLAVELDTAVLVCAHPSASGRSRGGSGYSGSTGWSNSVRSRLSLTVDEDDVKHRILTRAKSNYAEVGDEIHLYWKDWALTHLDQANHDYDTIEKRQCRQDFLTLLAEANKAGRNLSDSKYGLYAPKELAAAAKSKGMPWDQGQMEKAMVRLFADGNIVMEDVPHRKGVRKDRKRLVVRKAIVEDLGFLE